MIHSFLMIGQSNMAGRGDPADVEPIVNSKIKVLRNGRWQGMYFPVNNDRMYSGVCLAESFADCYSNERDVQVGLIPCADGGTSLDQWRPGGLLYDNAVYQARLASRTSTIAGILWHQGESDCSPSRYSTYAERLKKLIESLRRDLNLYDVPFLMGGLGDYLVKLGPDSDTGKNFGFVNDALRQVAAECPMTGFVSAAGLEGKDDNLHFNSVSLREFGCRYYEEFKKHEDKNKVFEEKSSPDDAVRSALELL